MFKIFTRAGGLILNKNSRILGRTERNLPVSSSDINRTLIIKSSLPQNKTNMEASKYTNRLSEEKSPYLLQHKNNPVQWYPWGDEAIKKAKEENKLIFLSVGYSSCHWCHVMETESFENEEIAKIMNEHFINIKVDREERPDIDKIYMNFVMMINGSGGWPMSVWLTPDLTPVTGGTYFPPTDRWGMKGFKTVLKQIAARWSTNQDQIKATGNKIIEAIRKEISEKPISPSLSDDPNNAEAKLTECIKIFKRNFDQEYGGFGSHPKFPEVSKLNFLFHAYMVKKDKDILDIVLKTLENISKGGIHDHVFGGFARYSVDREWHVPHFEKMLYDQGQLLSAYANAYKVTKDKFFLDTADRIFRYIMKDLHHPKGGFYSGEDADSLPTDCDIHKIEGAFYAWTFSEIRNEIEIRADTFNMDTGKVFEIYCYYYDVQEKGNVQPSSDPHGHLTGKNILIIRQSLEKTCKKFNITEEELTNMLKNVNDVLHEVRDKRPRPHLDTKIITGWNGLVLSGLSKLANTGCDKRDEYFKAAQDLVEFVKTYLYNEEKGVLIRSCYGKGTTSELAEILSEPINGFLDDYAFFIKGLLDWYKCSHDIKILEWAKELQDTQDKLFWDDINGGYFFSQENSPNIVVRLKEDHDGAEPCGNSVAARNLLFLSIYYEDKTYLKRAKKLIEFFLSISPFGYALPKMLSALLLIDRGMEMMAVVGPACEKTDEFIRIGRKYYIPGMIVVHFNTDDHEVAKRKTFEKFKMINNQPTVYLCHNKICQLPITDPKKLDDTFKENYVIN